MTYLRLFWLFLRLGMLNELEYRVNFYVQLLQSVVGLATALAGLGVVFSHTDTLGGWRPAELLALLGVYFLVGGASQLVIQPSMQRFMEDVRQGTLDFTLTKPDDAQVLVSIAPGRDLEAGRRPARAGRARRRAGAARRRRRPGRGARPSASPCWPAGRSSTASC